MDAREWLDTWAKVLPIRRHTDLMHDALLAVLDLHVAVTGPDPVRDGSLIQWCAFCEGLSNGGAWEDIEWPCATVRAVTRALGVE